jgi:hypothetical protein
MDLSRRADPSVPSPAPSGDLEKPGAALFSHVRQGIQLRAGVTRFDDLDLGDTNPKPHARQEACFGYSTKSEIFSQITWLNRPSQRCQLSKQVLRNEEEGLVRVPVELGGAIAVVIPLGSGWSDPEDRNRVLREPNLARGL